MPLDPIPDATLRATYTREQPYRHDWPRLFEDGMRDPVIRRLVELITRRQVSSFGRRRADRQGVKLRGLAPGETDRKRAASGDKDD